MARASATSITAQIHAQGLIMSPALVTLPQAHALTSKTFALPPCDGSLTIAEIYDWHLEHNPDHVLFVHASSPEDRTEVTFKHAVHAIHRAAQLLASRLGPSDLISTAHDVPLIAILATTDQITYICTWLGLVRAGYSVFHISTRNSPVALAHLLTNTRTDHVLVSADHGARTTLKEALALMSDYVNDPETFVSDMPRNEELFPRGYEDAAPQLMPARRYNLDSTLSYIHSSGTTAFPKPVRLTHRDNLRASYSLQVSAHDFCHTVLACHSVPPFHGLGVLTVLMAGLYGMTLGTFRPQFPQIAMSPDSVFEGAKDTRADYVICVPLFIEVWSRDRSKLSYLKSLRGLLYGGGPLNKAAGDYLTQEGVGIYVTFGCSEIGMMAPMLPPAPGVDWEWFTITNTFSTHFVSLGDGSYELLVLESEAYCPSVLNTAVNGVRAYATGDLLVPHPKKDGYWKVFGRADDQIMLNTGEKTNPGPLESILCQDPCIQAAVIFGRGRFQNGVVIQPKAEYVFDPIEKQKLSEFRAAIWPTVERMNAYAPQHSRLFKEMIMVMKPDKPFTYTAKGAARRQAVLRDYEPEIELLYEAVAETAQQEIPAPKIWSPDACLCFVRDTVHNVMKAKVRDEDDIFQHGCDSLQATWIRNTIARALRESPVSNGDDIAIDSVYANPSISQLACFLGSFADSGTAALSSATRAKADEMQELVSKYSSDFSKPTGTNDPPDHQCVVVTGTTGAFGVNILVALVNMSTVAKIFAFNRPSLKGENILDRQRKSLLERGLDGDIVHSPKVMFLQVDFNEIDLGLPADTLAEIRNSVTCIVHNAWRVDFNLSLASFEHQLIATRKLLDLALASLLKIPPRLLLVSSVAVLSNAEILDSASEDHVDNPAVAIHNGYSESKWVAEQLLANASAASSKFRTVVVRVGQLSGGVNGAWNASEWLPSLVASGPALGVLPDMDAEVSWIPADSAASTLAEIALTHNAPPMLHLAHPHPIRWSVIMRHVATELQLPLVPYREWLNALEGTLTDTSKSEVQHMRENPALRLLSFFRTAALPRPGREAMGVPKMSIQRAQETSSMLGTVQSLGESDVSKWMKYWVCTGALKAVEV